VFNLGAGEMMVIALLALIVLGPQRLPDAARQIGSFMGEIRKLSSGFQKELRTAFDEETEQAARAKGAAAVASPTQVDDAAASTPTIGALTPTDAPMPPAVPPTTPPRRRREPLTATKAAPARKAAPAGKAAPVKKAAPARKAAPAKKAAKRASP
jgi:sec-independent protein translocase protein TatB